MGLYRLTGVSEEQKGSTKPNILFLGFASDADAAQAASNIDSTVTPGLGVCSLVSADLQLASNYALPYPAGTEYSGRCAWGTAAGYRYNMPWSNAPAGFIPVTRVNAMIAAGFQIVDRSDTIYTVPSYGNAQIFTLTPSI